MVNSIVKHRRGHIDRWRRSVLVPEDGELIIVEFDDGSRKCKIGDGKHRFSALKYVDDSTKAELLDKLAKLEKDVESKLNSAALKYSVELGFAKDELAQQVVPFEEKVNRAVSDITKLDNRLTEQTTQLENQKASKEVTDELSGQVADIYAELYDINEDRAEIVNKIYSVENTLTEEIEARHSTDDERFTNINTKLDTLEKDTEYAKNFAEVVEEEVVAKFSDLEQNLEEQFEDVTEQLNTTKDRLDLTDARLNTQSKRIDAIISLKDGSTTGDAELSDIRTGYDGILYESAGEAVRQIGYDLNELKDRLPEYIPDSSVDGLLYENNLLYLTYKGEPISEPVEITGGGGGGGATGSVVKVSNNLPSTSIATAVGNEVYIDFTYTSFEEGVATGDGHASITINGSIISILSGTVNNGVAKRIYVTDYLKPGANTVKVTCSDQYGVSRSLVYNISVIELKVSSTFDPTYLFNTETPVVFRYTVHGQVEKTVHILLDGKEYHKATMSSSASGKASTLTITGLKHGSHKIQAYATATVGNDEISSNMLEYDILWVESEDHDAMLASSYNVSRVTQGDLVSIPFMIYDPAKAECTIDLIISSQVSGELIEVSRTALKVNREQQFWKTRKYPAGKTIFTISYTYTLYGIQQTISKSHTVDVESLDIDLEADDDSLQLYLSAQGRLNTEENPAVWTFTPKATAVNESPTAITTTFTDFNWKSNGWLPDSNGDTCLRLNGDARAVINFKPFTEDFKKLGKTIEFEFAVRDVNSRDAVIINCYGSDNKGFKATPDTALLQSGGNIVSCRYKDEERVRVAVTVEPSTTLSRFISIYLDGVLSGVKRYVDTDGFSQSSPVNIVLGSNQCGLDLYSVRIYNKALSTAQILENYIADQADPSTKQNLFTDNDILDGNDAVSYERVKALGKLPIVTFTGQMPTYKGDKKKKSVRMKFEDPENPSLNFDVLLDQIDVQGTSSQFYVRKNWKVKLPEAKQHMLGAIPSKVFCLKVDYAEATGTHNTGTANYVETLYDRAEVTLPPQKDDTRVRTTIQGFPCVIFEKATEDSEPVFSSKANFNYDKGSEEAFGFSETYKDYGVECWEFCNNTSPSCNFTGSIISDWSADFEPRYVPESANYERIEKLLEKKDNAANGKDTISTEELEELAALQASCIANFKEMHDWVLSTATYELIIETDSDGNDKVVGTRPINPPADAKITINGVEYPDNATNRLLKFEKEFENYFNMHYCSIYYVFTFFALMTDQRAKNMFLTRWKEADGVYRWLPYFYDNDTIFGINNEGALVFDYYHEDTDKLGSSNVYNGQNSILWNNFRQCFAANILNTYKELRSSGKLTYDKIIDQYVTKHSDEWSAAIYNADAEYKYVSMAREIQTEGDYAGSVDDSNLYQVRGPGEHHLRYFIANRLNYCDSKWYAGKYPDDYIFLRIYTPTTTIPFGTPDEELTKYPENEVRIYKSLKAVPANPNITVTPFSDMYAGVKYKANGKLQQERLQRGESHTFEPPTPETFNDTETGIYGASELSSLGDLSGLYCGVISLGKASKLTDITIGNPDPNYHNDNFREIRVGANRLLRSIDLRNCSGLGLASGTSIDGGWDGADTGHAQTTLDLSGCPNIETIYTEGTNLQTVALPDSGYIETLHLPASTTILNIKNQKNIKDFSIESYANIKTLVVENCPTLDTNAILLSCRDANGKYTVERARLTGLTWDLPDASFLKTLFAKTDAEGNFISGIRGIDENNYDLAEAYLVGTCHIDELSGAEYAEIKEHYPFLDLTFGKMDYNVKFIYPDTNGTEHTETISLTSTNSVLGDVSDFIPEATPYWPENDAFTYEFYGWSRKHQVSKGVEDNEADYLDFVQADAMTGIIGDRTLYPIFKAIRKSYPVTFVNPTADEANQILTTVDVPYGSTAVYPGSAPTKLDVPANVTNLYDFTGWYPSTEAITGPLTCYAQFAILDKTWYTLVLNDIEYTTNQAARAMSITKCLNNFSTNPAIKVPETFKVHGADYVVTSLGGFTNHNHLKLISMPSTVDTILTVSGSGAFSGCSNLTEVTLHEGITTIGTQAFLGCGKLTAIHIPASLTSIGDGAFSKCSALAELTVADGNPVYVVIDDCLIDRNSGALIMGLGTGVIPQNGEVRELRPYCFAGANINTVEIPYGLTTVASNAFTDCKSLEQVTLPSTLISIEATCFMGCSRLKSIEFPETLTTIRSYVFHGCPMESVAIPSAVTEIGDNAFGGQTKLKTVTFKKQLDANGNIIAPEMHKNAFAGSGSVDGVVFNVPWSEDYDYNYIEKVNGVETKIDPTGWGARNFTINYNYEEVD